LEFQVHLIKEKTSFLILISAMMVFWWLQVMDVPLPLDKLALNLINNESAPGNTTKYVPVLFFYFFICFG